MKLGVFTALFGQQLLEKTLDYIKKMGVEMVELGTGNYPGASHCNPDELLTDDKKVNAFKKKIGDKGLEISALSCHGNPLHPNERIAAEHREVQRKTILLAEKFRSGKNHYLLRVSGGSETGRYPNWRDY